MSDINQSTKKLTRNIFKHNTDGQGAKIDHREFSAESGKISFM